MTRMNDLNDIFYMAGVEEEASKLNFCRKKLETDPHRRVRWLWDFIRYAKEATEGLNQLDISITVKDDRFIFSYQSSVFTVRKVSELVRHSNINSFAGLDRDILKKLSKSLLTTFALSDVFELQGFIRKDKGKQQVSAVKIEAGVEPEPEVAFKQFQILLDRRDNSVENPLTDRIIFCEGSLQNQILNNPELPINKLPELKTVFTFLELSEDSFLMVDQALKALRLVAEYLMLFNPSIKIVTCKDERSRPKFRTFICRSQKNQNILGFKMLHINFIVEKTIFFKSLIYDFDENSIVAIPVSIIKEGFVGREPIASNCLKVFNGLPVVGCPDLGFNFVFSSEALNQSISLGGLNLNEDEESQKCLQNWDTLYKVFKTGQRLILKVAEISQFGYETILRLSQMKILMNYPLFEGRFKDCFMETKRIVADQPSINTSQEAPIKISEIIFLNDVACGQITAKKYSMELNATFRFLFSPYALGQAAYKDYYDTVMSTEADWPEIKHVGLVECLKKLQEHTFEQLMKICMSQEDYFFEMMDNIYSFLTKHHPGLMRNSNGLAIVMCLDRKFHRISELQPIYHQGALSNSHEILARQLKIATKEKFVLEIFAHHFSHIPNFDIKAVERMYFQRFRELRNDSKVGLLDFLYALGCVLKTFGLTTSKYLIYQSLKDTIPLKKIEVDGVNCFVQETKDKSTLFRRLLDQFEKGLLEKIHKGMSNRQSLMNFAHLHLKEEYHEEKVAIKWFANLASICKKRLLFGLNWGLHFQLKTHLKKFVTLKEPHIDMDLLNYPNEEDLNFVNNLKQLLKPLGENRAIRYSDLNLMWQLPHPSTNFTNYLQASSEIVTVKDIYGDIHLDKYDEWPNEAKLALISELNRWSLQKQHESSLFLKDKIAFFEPLIARIPTELMRLTQEKLSVSEKQIMYKFYTDPVVREAMTKIVKQDRYTEITIGIRNRMRNAKEKEIAKNVKIEAKE